MRYSIIICSFLQQSYTYTSEFILVQGQIVSVPLRGRVCLGIVMEILDSSQLLAYEIKAIEEVHEYVIPGLYLKLLNWATLYYAGYLGAFASLIVNQDALTKSDSKIFLIENQKLEKSIVKLNDVQENAFNKLKLNNFNVSVLRGVTGSGKTMVYLKAVCEILDSGKQVLIMIPEIILNQHLTNKIFDTFGVETYVWNSDITKAQKREIWKGVYNGTLKVIIGTRSAIFLPFCNLGLIVIDEEHDSSYKQENTPVYNAKNLAIVLSKINNSPIILSSATISLETMKNCVVKANDYNLVEMDQRFGGSSLPLVEIIENFDPHQIISDKIFAKIENAIAHKKQSLLYMNRRGYAPITYCTKCHNTFVCPNCAVYLVNHKANGNYICHYCNFTILNDKKCMYCQAENTLNDIGLGIEKIFEIVSQKFPQNKIFIASSDTLNNRKKINTFIQDMENNEIEIVIGTQILAKGHHFRSLDFCAILDIDFAMNSPDLRSLEKSYQMICQISGRAGRENSHGIVYVQTKFDAEKIKKSWLLSDFNTFTAKELEARELHGLPPYSKFVSIILSGNVAQYVEAAAVKLCNTDFCNGVVVLGPIAAPINKIKGKTRWRILLKSQKNLLIQKNIFSWLSRSNIKKSIKILIDVDPISFF